METPFNLEAEKAVIGSSLISEECAFEAADKLRPQDFYHANHQHVFQAILEMIQGNNPPEMVGIMDILEKNKKAWHGVTEYLAELIAEAPFAPALPNLIDIIRENAKKRKVIEICMSAVQAVRQNNQSIDDIMSRIENDIFALSATEEKTVKTLKEAYKTAYVQIAEAARAKKENKLPGLKFGFPKMERMLAGLKAGESIIIGARPSVGKSAFAMNMADSVQRHGLKVLFFSLEMIAEEFAKRIMAANSKISLQKLRLGEIGADEISRISKDMSMLGDNLVISDQFNMNMVQIMARAQEARRKYGIDLIIIDYLQLIQWAPGFKDERLAIDDITRKIKIMTRELNVPIVSLSQIKRNSGGDPAADSNPPTLGQLRGSGGIENNADTVILLHRKNKMETEAKAYIAKQRNGPLGMIDLHFNHDQVLFTEEETMREYQGETPFDGIEEIV